MIRIIAGEFRGRKLDTPKDERIRPTTDRVKESVFNILQNRIAGRRVLDLFAGSGGLGLEALSRGAAYVAFVENNPDNEKLINGNIAKLSVEDRCRLFMMDFERAIGLMASRGVKFDVVFIDPPYNDGLYDRALELLFKSKLLNDGAICVVEHPETMNMADIDGVYSVYDRRKYGKSAVSFVQEDMK